MKTDLLTIEYDTELLKKRRIWYYVALALFLLSAITRQPLFFLAVLFALLIGYVPDLWYRYALRHLVIRQHVNQQHVLFGEEVILSVSIENQKFLPLPWLEIEDRITPPLTLLGKRASRLQAIAQDTLSSTWLLWSFQRVTRRYRVRCQSRGLHVFGPMRLRSSDPFGWLEREVTAPTYETLLVYPLLAPIETLGLASFLPFGDYATPHRLLEDPLQIAGTRDYVLGDDPRRIHWKATAHAGALRSKVYEPSSMRRLLILLETWNYSDAYKGADPDIQELSICAAASLAVWALDEGYIVGLLANCSIMASPGTQINSNGVQPDFSKTLLLPMFTDSAPPVVRVPYSRGQGQYERLLSTLAGLAPQYNSPIDRMIDTEFSMFSIGTTILLISAASSLSASTVERLDDLNRRGSAVYLALADDSNEKASIETYDLPVYSLGGKEKWHELIRTVGSEERGTPGTSATSLQLD